MPKENLSDRNIARLQDPDAFVGRIVSEIKKSETVLNPWKNRLVKYYDLYKMNQTKKHYEGLANIFVPEILRAVETVVGNLYKAITGSIPWFEYIGREESDQGAAQAHTQLVRWQMDENRFKPRLVDSLRQMVITGLTVRKVLWDFQEIGRRKREVRLEEKIDPITKEKIVKRRVEEKDVIETLRDYWTFEPVDLLAFHISDVTTPYNDIQKARWIAEQYKVDKQWLKERSRKEWISSKQANKVELAKISSEAENFKNRRLSDNYSQQEDSEAVEIIERWGLLEASLVYSQEELKKLNLSADDFVETVVIIANRKEILKLEANPFWFNQKPYLSCPYVPQDFEFSGIGVAQIGEKLQEELNDTRNQTMDNKTLILMNMWLKGRNSGIKNQDLRIRPNGVIPTNDINGLTPLRPPVLTGVGVNIEGVVKEDLRQSVGAASNLQGIAQAGVGTATEASLLNKESFNRLALVAEMYAELILKPLFVFVEYLNYQFYNNTKAIRIIGTQGIKFKELSPDEIAGYKDIVIRLSTDQDENPAVKRQQLIQFLTIIQQMPPDVIAFHWKLLDRIYKSFFPNGRSLEDIYEPPPGAAELLTPEEEIDLVIAEQPVHAQRGQNHQQHVAFLEQQMAMMKFALSETSFALLQQLIMEHQQMLEQEMVAEAASLLQASEQGGAKINKGQIPGASAFTQPKNSTEGDLARNVNGR